MRRKQLLCAVLSFNKLVIYTYNTIYSTYISIFRNLTGFYITRVSSDDGSL